ncbi:MAG: glutamine--fructose-6-phosphate transaminase (isomerizing) [Chloroflexota bacterium]
MCGIIGYVGNKEAKQVLLKGLKRLQYRGYDSCGIAVRNDGITIHKNVGTVEELERTSPKLKGRAGIGHTRWATHGGVSQLNAHPHLDCTGTVAVVHNGVITNYAELKEHLTKEGHVFRSDTDSEVISHLIEKHYRGNFEEAVSRAVRDLSGSFAIVVMHRDHPKLIGARRECPLILGKNERAGNFIASDVLAFLEHTDRAVYLEDGDIAVATDTGVTITNSDGPVERSEVRIEWGAEESKKAGYEHFMLKEIHEQPKVIDRTLSGRIKAVEPGVELELKHYDNLSGITLIACGTSYHAALVGEQVISELTGIPARAVIASEFKGADALRPESLLIGISQSGETADTLRALKTSHEAGARILAITNVPGSTISRYADQTLYTYAGPEVAVAATKTFTTQLVALYLLAIAYSKAPAYAAARLKDDLRALSGKVESILESEPQIMEQAGYLSHFHNAFLIARGINYPAVLEGALKLKEVAYVHAEAFPAGELKHGPFALLSAVTPVIAIVPEDDTREPMLTSIKEVKARGAPVLALATENDEAIEQLVDTVIRVPAAQAMLSPLLNVTALQLLAYYIARERGCPIDMPVNLAKSVTVP